MCGARTSGICPQINNAFINMANKQNSCYILVSKWIYHNLLYLNDLLSYWDGGYEYYKVGLNRVMPCLHFFGA